MTFGIKEIACRQKADSIRPCSVAPGAPAEYSCRPPVATQPGSPRSCAARSCGHAPRSEALVNPRSQIPGCQICNGQEVRSIRAERVSRKISSHEKRPLLGHAPRSRCPRQFRCESKLVHRRIVRRLVNIFVIWDATYAASATHSHNGEERQLRAWSWLLTGAPSRPSNPRSPSSLYIARSTAVRCERSTANSHGTPKVTAKTTGEPGRRCSAMRVLYPGPSHGRPKSRSKTDSSALRDAPPATA